MIPEPANDGGLSPTQALRVLRAIHSDPKITAAQRCALTWVVLAAENETALAWASYDNIRERTGLARATIREALRRAEGKYLTRAGLGWKGAIRWRVAVQPLNCSSTTEPQAAVQPALPAVQPALVCSSPTEPILTSLLTPSSRPKKKKAAAPPDARVKTFIDWFSETYKTATGNGYIVTWAKDSTLVKRLLGLVDGDGGDPVAKLQRATAVMLEDPWGREHADIGLLSSKINTWRRQPAAQPKEKSERDHGRASSTTSKPEYHGGFRKSTPVG